MSRRSTQEIERYYFGSFLIHANLQPTDLLYADRPDVQITLDGRRIGVEITRFYLTDGSYEWSEQAQAPRRSSVLSLAQRKFTEDGGPPIEVHVDFNPLCPIVDIESAATELAALVASLQSQTGTVVGPGHESNTPLRYIYQNGVHYPDAKWKGIQVYSTPILDTQRLEQVVMDKSAKAAQYAACDAYWLLLVVDFADRAQDQEIMLPHDFQPFRHPFERVIVYKPQFAQILDIPR